MLWPPLTADEQKADRCWDQWVRDMGGRDKGTNNITDAEEPDIDGLQSPYDPEDTDEDDLWFLPAMPEDRAPTDMPLPAAVRTKRFKPDDWLLAETEVGRLFAEAAAQLARYDERLRRLPGCHERIALLSASAALEVQGDWLPAERIALYVALRERGGDEALELRQADWAVRRYLSGLDPRDDLSGYLGRHPTDRDGFLDLDLFGEPARGEEFSNLSREWLSFLDAMEANYAPPLIRAGAAFHHWRTSAISAPGIITEPAVIASVLAADELQAGFVPVTLGGRLDLLAQGGTEARLRGWLRAVRDGCARALLELERVETWRNRATDATRDLSGKTPPRIIDTLVRSTLTSTDMLSSATKSSKAAIRRNMAEFENRGLVREVTGQGRYRFWGIKA